MNDAVEVKPTIGSEISIINKQINAIKEILFGEGESKPKLDSMICLDSLLNDLKEINNDLDRILSALKMLK